MIEVAETCGLWPGGRCFCCSCGFLYTASSAARCKPSLRVSLGTTGGAPVGHLPHAICSARTSIGCATERHFKQSTTSAAESQTDPGACRTRDLVAQPRKPPAIHIFSVEEHKNVARRDEATPVSWAVVHQSFDKHFYPPSFVQTLAEFDPYPPDLRVGGCGRWSRVWNRNLVR
jgi:hypothetical protein